MKIFDPKRTANPKKTPRYIGKRAIDREYERLCQGPPDPDPEYDYSILRKENSDKHTLDDCMPMISAFYDINIGQ